MSREFDLKFDEYKQNDPSQPMGNSQDKYPASSYARDLCFILPDGKMIAFSYSYLVSKECVVEGHEITLSYTTHVIVLKGCNLKPLFIDMLSQIPRIIKCVSDRYNVINDEAEPSVNEITIKQIG